MQSGKRGNPGKEQWEVFGKWEKRGGKWNSQDRNRKNLYNFA